MKFFPAPQFQTMSGWDGYSKPKGKKTSMANGVRTTFANFAQGIPFRDARPLLTDFWKDIAGNETAAINIFWRASSAGRNERKCFYMEALIDDAVFNEEVLGSLLPKNWPKLCNRVQKEFDERIGFTFLLIENKSSETIEDISLFFRETYSENRVIEEYDERWRAKQIRSTITSVPDQGALQNLVAKYSTAQAAEEQVKQRPLKELKMSSMNAGEKRIIMINIFFSNERNLPAGYLYGIYEFEKADYSTVRHGRIGHPIRRPYLEKAGRVAVPYGWMNQ